MNDDLIREIFLYCDNKDPDGLYAEDVDILEFGRKIAQVAFISGARAERRFCVDFTATLNKEVAKILQTQEMQYADGGIEGKANASGPAREGDD